MIVKHLLSRMVSGRHGMPQRGSRRKLFFDRRPHLIYAVGDIHGCYSLLLKMEQFIVRDAANISDEKWIILLGDYVDRGFESAAVLNHLSSPPPPGFKRFCLAGNHEELMLSYLDNPAPEHDWLRLGGRDTLRSYGIDAAAERGPSIRGLLASRIPPHHVAFLQAAPSLLSVPHYTFVHGGTRAGIPLERQLDQDLLWSRPDFDTGDVVPTGFITVHGHTPVQNIELKAGRINVDTGAFKSGILSGVRIDQDHKIVKLAVS